MNSFGRRTARAAAISALSLAGIANADSVTATVNNVNPAQIVGITYNGNSLGNAYAGSINWTGVAGNANGLTGAFSTFCIDLTQDIYLGNTYTYDVADIHDAPNPLPPTAAIGDTGMSLTSAQEIEKLYALEYDGIGTDNDKGAAFQIAIWELLYDTSSTHDVSTGMFSVSGASSNVITTANLYVAAASAPGALAFHDQLLALTSPTIQDQLFLGGPNGNYPPPPNDAVAPTPAAAGAIPLLSGLALARGRKRRTAL